MRKIGGRRRSVAALACALGLAVAACTGETISKEEVAAIRASPTTSPDHTTTPPTPPTDGATGELEPRLEWGSCDAFDTAATAFSSAGECAALFVPRDHFAVDATAVGAPTLTLAVRRLPAREPDDRIGAILFNPGGPGAPALDLPDALADQLPRKLRDRFDLIGWDPRGVGQSAGVDCETGLDSFVAADRSPDDADEIDALVDASRALADACAASDDADLLPYLSTSQTVEDMEWIRRALGDEQLGYLGFSYGTYIGGRYAETHPERVGSFVLDGPVDPSVQPAEMIEQQGIGFDRALQAFLDACSADDECAFHAGGDTAGAFDKLMRAIDAESLYAEAGGEERGLGPGEADLGVAVALYSGDAAYELLAEALAEAATGDGSELLRFADLYTGRVGDDRYDGSLTAFFATACIDAPQLDFDAMAATADRLGEVAPRLGLAGLWLGLPCTYWPVPADPDATPHALVVPPATPILVTGTTGDPATPVEWARSLADQLGVPLLLADSAQHSALFAGDACIDEAIFEFLLDPSTQIPTCGGNR